MHAVTYLSENLDSCDVEDVVVSVLLHNCSLTLNHWKIYAVTEYLKLPFLVL